MLSEKLQGLNAKKESFSLRRISQRLSEIRSLRNGSQRLFLWEKCSRDVSQRKCKFLTKSRFFSERGSLRKNAC